MKKIFMLIILVVLTINSNCMSRKEMLQALSKENIEKFEKEQQNKMGGEMPESLTGNERGNFQTAYLNPRYNRYSNVISAFATPAEQERLFQQLEKKRYTKIAIITISIIIAVFLIFLLLRKNFRPSKSEEKIKEVAKYDDLTLTDDELQISKVLYELKEKVNDPELMDLLKNAKDGTVVKIAFEIFKDGVWRLLDNEYANYIFDNKEYVNSYKQKIITDINQKFIDDYFTNMTEEGINKFILKWVIKTRDDTMAIKNILFNSALQQNDNFK